MGAELRFADAGGAAGADAKAVKVTVTARSGDPVHNPYWGPIVHDFAGMTVKPRIPLDYAHDYSASIGYLDSFDTSSGDLVCTGEIVLVDAREDGYGDDGASALVAKMKAGIPYQASIEFDEEMTLEYIPQGMSATVNGRDIAGPLTIVRQWELNAVGICKFGVDDNTSAAVQFSKKNKDKNQPHKPGGFFVRLAKTTKGINSMSQTTKAAPVTENKQAVTAPAAVEAPKVEPVAAPAATPVTTLSAASASPASDQRNEFKQFVAAFGAEKAATYFSEGKTFGEATAAHLAFQTARIDELTKKLGSVDRGAEAPAKFSSTESGEKGGGKTGMSSVISIAGKK